MPGQGPAKGMARREASGSGWRLVSYHFFTAAPHSPRRPQPPRPTPAPSGDLEQVRNVPLGPSFCKGPEEKQPSSGALLCSGIWDVWTGGGQPPLYIGRNHAHLEIPPSGGVALVPLNGTGGGAGQGGSRWVLGPDLPPPSGGGATGRVTDPWTYPSPLHLFLDRVPGGCVLGKEELRK